MVTNPIYIYNKVYKLHAPHGKSYNSKIMLQNLSTDLFFIYKKIVTLLR